MALIPLRQEMIAKLRLFIDSGSLLLNDINRGCQAMKYRDRAAARESLRLAERICDARRALAVLTIPENTIKK